jgi:hypothetical protein
MDSNRFVQFFFCSAQTRDGIAKKLSVLPCSNVPVSIKEHDTLTSIKNTSQYLIFLDCSALQEFMLLLRQLFGSIYATSGQVCESVSVVSLRAGQATYQVKSIANNGKDIERFLMISLNNLAT